MVGPSRPRRFAGLARCLAVGAALHALPAGAQSASESGFLPGWDFGGSNTLRLEHYRIDGDEGGAPFPDEGFQPYNEFDFNFSKTLSPYETFRGDLSGLANASPYRSPEEGFLMERVNLTWEKGDVAVPFRIEAGDFFGYFSFRSLQRSLKGTQIDLQPVGGFAGERHSIQLLSGIDNPVYRDLDFADNLFNGVSWLIEGRLGKVAINGVHNHRQSDSADGHPDLNQGVLSLAAEREFRFAGQSLTVETELSRLDGDIDLGSDFRLDRTGYGKFVQISGKASVPLTLSARWEHYDDDFRPNGGIVTPNRRSLLFRGGYAFKNNYRLDGRAQKFTENLQNASATDVSTAGLTVSGPLPFVSAPGSSLRLDTFVQSQETRNESIDNVTQSASLDLNAPVGRDWTARAGFQYVITDDKADNAEIHTRALTLGGERRISVLGLGGSVSPALLLRNLSGPAKTTDIGPSIGMRLAGGAHSVSANYSFLRLDPAAAQRVARHDVVARYQYAKGGHTLGSEFEYRNRSPETGDSTNAYRIMLFWRVGFTRPAGAVAAVRGPGAAPRSGGPTDFRLTEVTPGMAVAAAEARLARFAIGGGLVRPGVTVYETRLLADIDQRQRLAVVHARGRVVKTALIIDLSDVGRPETVSQTFERVRETLIRRHGPPTSSFALGAYAPSLAADVNRAAFIRTADWQTEGGTIRLGIPRRLDRKVRIEVQFARQFASPRETLWSVGSVP